MNVVLVKDDYLNKRTKTRIFYEELISEDEYLQRRAQKQRLAYAMRKREQEAIERHAHETRNGYCPRCFMQIPLSGKCDCGYEVK